jgi:hypothetical protein
MSDEPDGLSSIERCIASLEKAKALAEKIVETPPGEISDGYHTFNELYEHRFVLFIALCKRIWIGHEDTLNYHGSRFHVWRSKVHSDGDMYAGWFIMGISKFPGHQISYHLPIARWKECNFADTLSSAPQFDGHTSADVLKRIARL